MNPEDRTVAALDIGSSKITALVANVAHSEEIEIIGMGVVPSRGIKAGTVTNIEQTVRSIREAIEEAELMSAVEIDEVLLNITGKHVKGDNSTGVVAITNKDRVVAVPDIYRVIDAAQAIRIPSEQEILHVLSREFKVDDQNGIKDPTGMVGIRLEADVHIVTGGSTHIQNTEKAVNEAGLRVKSKVLSSLASSQALLSDGEKDLGVAVVDIGAGVIDLIIYVDGGVAYTTTIPIGGHHLTQDISIGLKTTQEAAEMLKKRYGSVTTDEIDPMETIEVPSIGDRPPRNTARRDLAEIMEARMREMLEMIDHELVKSGRKSILSGGVIFTGGSSMVNGLIPLAEDIIQLGVSVGYPRNIIGLTDKITSPVFSGAVGLIQYWARYGDIDQQSKSSKGFMTKLKTWIQENL